MVAMLILPLMLGAGAAEAASNVLFILDASGSMAGKLGGQVKMDAAREAFKSLLAGLPKDANVGLEVYGHHGNKDCSVIEVMNPVAPLDAAAISANVQGLTPRHGATPLAAALEQGGKALESASGEKTIVLISDGKETCGGDPAAVATRLRAKGINITTHVVGLGVNEEEKAQLSGIAAAGGGKYYAANNADELKKSLVTIRKVVTARKPKTRVIFRDDFNDDFLADAWKVMNPNPDGMVVDSGKLSILTMPGSLEDKKIQNVVIYDREIGSKNYDVVTKIITKISSGNTTRGQQVGLVMWQDKDNFLLVIVTGTNPWNNRAARLIFRRSGKWIPGMELRLPDATGPATYYLKVSKRKFRYTAFCSVDGHKWKKIGTEVALGKHFKPAIHANRVSDEEIMANFDWFEIRAVE